MRKVTGHHNLYKDENGVVVVKEKGLLEKIQKRKQKELRMDALEDRLNRIEYMLERLIRDGNK